MEALKFDRLYTYRDYVTWDDKNRYELIDGVVYMMSSPSRLHQKILTELLRQLSNFLVGKSCEVYPAPFDVRLHGNGDKETTVVQPDIVVVCETTKLDDKGCNGAPDMVIEILSPSNAKHDTIRKFSKYLEAGVKEYWVVDPERQTVFVHILENGKYVVNGYEEPAVIDVTVLEGCQLNLNVVYNLPNLGVRGEIN